MLSIQSEPDVLVIEDFRTFRFPAVYARDLFRAEYLLFNRPWREVWWDHDMGLLPSSPDVMSLVNKLERLAHEGTILPIKRMVVHTFNSNGGDHIMAALSPWYDTIRVRAADYLAPA